MEKNNILPKIEDVEKRLKELDKLILELEQQQEVLRNKLHKLYNERTLLWATREFLKSGEIYSLEKD